VLAVAGECTETTDATFFFERKTRTNAFRCDGLLALIADFRDGITVKEVEDAYPSVLDDLQVTEMFPVHGFKL
jgi:hypothetical protein